MMFLRSLVVTCTFKRNLAHIRGADEMRLGDINHLQGATTEGHMPGNNAVAVAFPYSSLSKSPSQTRCRGVLKTV